MKLEEYRKKRDASRTNEPFGADPSASGETWAGAYVVHQHDATRMHYDLRLEVGGVLASFAIPHGPSFDPADKHLAIHTEDHPIEYLDFEAIIPEGTYGAGPMILWDTGRVRYLEMPAEKGLETGKLDFVLEGHKLRGRFSLVRIKPSGARARASKEGSREWLLLKKKDAFSNPERDIVAEQPRSVLSGLTVGELASAPRIAEEIEREAEALGAPAKAVDARRVHPMLCLLGELPEGPEWIYELKVDGVRILADKGERVELRYRTKRSATDAYPEVVRAIEALAARRVVLDGEIVSLDEAGRPSFQRLGKRIHLTRARDVKRLMVEVPVIYMVFDLLAVGSRDLRKLPLSARKALLRKLLPAPGILRVLDDAEGAGVGARMMDFCRENHLEGVVAKRKGSTYTEGPTRTGDWVKSKTEREEDFVVVGLTRSESKSRRIGAVDIATYEGDRLIVRGKVGSGLDEAAMDALFERLSDQVIPEPACEGEFLKAPAGRDYVRPVVVVRVRFLAFHEDGRVRHPVFLGIADDRHPRDCTARPEPAEGAPPDAPLEDEPGALATRAEDPRPSAPPGADQASPSNALDGPPIPAVTNRGKVFWPDEGITKGDLVDYYRTIAPWLLPYLRDRPIMLVRYPDGIRGKSFYQWNVPHGMPKWVKSVSLAKHAFEPTEEGGPEKHVFVIDRVESLVYIANLACIPVHVLASRVTSPALADFLTIDFDVNLASLREAIVLAKTLREILDEVGLQGFPKTSGQTGLHVFVPLFGGGVSPRAARTMADLFGRLITDRHPDIATMERTVSKRGPRVYVDTGQTGPSRTIVAPYSVRATPGARVSTPLSWDEVHEGLDPGGFTMRTVPARLESIGDPMAPLLEARPDLPRAMAALERLLTGPKRRA